MSTKKPAARPAKRRPIRPTPKPRTVKPQAHSEKVDAQDVHIVSVPGTRGKGDGPGGEKWRIDVNDLRAGEVFINLIDEPPVGPHASIQIYLNVKSQGRGIGSVAYRKACEASQHHVIYAHMRKSNTASRRAAENAGFVDVSPPGFIQLILVRRASTRARPSP
ncbi:N-acetyltransferase [Variovorax guangxiensis]|uniref:N-acetyltransferase n=1 Tax=Variovorax guangxiensis TaxID=1775474 RepID=A0A433MTI7_9BURK|nr:GNAT family protein [Variovorax guangxiensis]RUR71102.1 N-acetyltransferase [Variovorax guangxiensis]